MSDDDPQLAELFQQLKATHRYDCEKWTLMVQKLALISTSHDFHNQIYEEAFAQYPSSLSIWQSRIDCELSCPETNPSKMAELFEKGATWTMSPSMWDHYLTWAQNNNFYAEETIQPLYERAIDLVGYDLNSVNLWMSFIYSIKKKKPENQFEEQLQLDTLRKTYQKAVLIPIIGVEGIWKEYDSFENSLNKVNGRKILSEKSGSYMNARALVKELRSFHDGKINRSVIVNYWIASSKDCEQVSNVLAWIEWEQKNQVSLPPESYYERLNFVFKSALAHVRSSEQVWYLYSKFVNEMVSKLDQPDLQNKDISLLKEAIEYLPLSISLNSALLELYELNSDIERGKELIENLFSNFANSISELESFISRSEDNSDVSSALLRKVEKEKHDHCSFFKIAIRFARRTQGLTLARQYFAKARKLPYCSHEIYSLSGNIEYFLGKDAGVAFKVFELGMKLFSDVPAYIQAYMKLLLIKLDESNIKSLFERALKSLAHNKAAIIELWSILICHEMDFGHFIRLKELSDRLLEAFPEAIVPKNKIHHIVPRKRELGIDTHTPTEILQNLIRASGPASSYSGPVLPIEIVFEMFKAAKV